MTTNYFIREKETTKLFYNEYLYKLVLRNNLVSIFRGQNFTYARQQMFSSIIWATKPAEMILKSMGKRPSEYLNPKIKSKTKLRILGLQTARSTFAGFLGISQIFGGVII